jgi:curved DNA-binding protein CbpA
MNDFETLGVTEDMDADQIRRVYRREIMRNHPDVSKDPVAAHNRTAELTAAFARLKAKERQSDAPPRPTHEPFIYPKFDESSKAPRRPQKSAYDARSSTDEAAQQSMAERVAQAAREKLLRQMRASGPVNQNAEKASADTSITSEIDIQPAQKASMALALEKRKQQEAHKRYLNTTGTYADPRRKLDTRSGELPGFHMVDRMSLKGQTVQLHLTGDAKTGRNVIAMPKLIKTGANALQQSSDIDFIEITADKSGKLSAAHQGDDGLKLEVFFGQERQNRRDQDPQI